MTKEKMLRENSFEGGLSPNDVSIQGDGRIIIKNKEFAEFITNLKAAGKLGPNIRLACNSELCGSLCGYC